jgi:hypothetical protein
VVLHLGPGVSAYKIRVAGRWPSPLDLPGLGSISAEAQTALTSEVLPELCDIPLRRAWMSRALRDLHVLFEDASQFALSSPAAASWWKGRLSQSPSPSASRPRPVRLQLLSSTPLLGLSKDCPFVDTRFERPLPGSICATHAPHFSHPSAWSCHRQARSVLVVPPDFDGFLRSSAAGLLHPAADHGVHCVSAFGAPDSSWLPDRIASTFRLDSSSCTWASPQCAIRDPHLESPSEGFPSGAAVPGFAPED